MKRMVILFGGFLCLGAGQAPSGTFEEQLSRQPQELSDAVRRVQEGFSNPKPHAFPPNERRVPGLAAADEANGTLLVLKFKQRSGRVVKARVTAKKVRSYTEGGVPTMSFEDPRVEVEEDAWSFWTKTKKYKIDGYDGGLDSLICKELTGLQYVGRNMSTRWSLNDRGSVMLDTDGNVVATRGGPTYIKSMTCCSSDCSYE